jgi:anti-sigma factor RsiW
MWHPDDGVPHALLDGELTGDARLELEAHLRSCTECDARFLEAKSFAAEADSLVNAIEVPPARAPGSIRPPVRRRIRLTTMAWAATLVLAAGLGYWGQDAIRRAAPTELREGDRPASGPESVAVPAPMSKTDPDARALATEQPSPSAGSEAAPKAEPAEESRQAENWARVAEPVPQAKPAAPDAPAAPVVGGVAAAAEAAREDAAASPGWRTVTMEQAVQVLGGAVRLVDGMTPERFDVGPGTLVPGGDPTREVVRVVYVSGAVAVISSVPRTPAMRRAARYEDAAAKRLAAQTAGKEIEWRSSDGFRYVVTGTVGAESLRALADRVR